MIYCNCYFEILHLANTNFGLTVNIEEAWIILNVVIGALVSDKLSQV